jgi:hypothetical protein
MQRTYAYSLFVFIALASLLACSTGAPPAEEHARIGTTAEPITATPPAWPTAAQWVPLKKAGVSVTDPPGDAQKSRDVVGDAANPAAFLWADAEHMYFRLRIGDTPLKTATTLNPFGWGCELDTDGVLSTYEYFINVNGIINGDIVQLLQNTVKKTDDPKDTSEVVLENGVSNAAGGYSPLTGGTVVNGTAPHARVSVAGTALGGGTDYFVDFALDKNDFPVAPAADAFNPNTQPFHAACGTSNNATNLAADLTSQSGATTLSTLFGDPVFCGATGCSGGCFVDTDCAGTQFCSSPTCTNKLANGTAIPTVVGHNPALTGTCTAAAGAAVCASGVCDTADNECGFAVGDGPCTPVNALTVCRSGACSVSNKCEPAGGCLVDGDCGGAQFCDTGTRLCTAKIANGIAVPTIANHTPALNGTCSASVGTAVCSSAVCDTTDNKCGFANGDGTCTPATAGTVCRSGACAGGVCAASGACTTDASCAVTQFCNTQTGVCTAKLPNSSAVPTITGHTPPLTGTCTSAVGTAVCSAAACDVVDNECGFGDGDGTCDGTTAATVCRSGACSVSGVCKPAGGCIVDTDCSGAQFCNTQTRLCTSKLPNATAIPTITGHAPPLTGVCSVAVGTAVCVAGVCDTADSKCGFADGDGSCSAVTAGTVCRSGACSVSRVCEPAGGCLVDGDCGGTEFCNTALRLCVSKVLNGVAVPTVANHTPALTGVCGSGVGAVVCASGVCDLADNECGFADGDGSCTVVNAATVCRSGTCSPGGVCSGAGGCTTDASCTSAQFCNTETSVCTPKLANGTIVPTITGHTPPLTGVCDAASGAAVCTATVCDTDNLCGFADGHGTCTVGNAATVCRSGACSGLGVCAAAGSCAVDGECAATDFCNTQTALCAPKLSNSVAIPTITGHTPALTGTCSDAVGAAVCAAGVCDVADQKCGFADGDGACTAGNAATVCRGGVCTAGTCGVPTGCATDSNCTAGQFCNTELSVCTPKLKNGILVPSLTGHTPPLTGACAAGVGAAVCEASVCDAADNECGFANDHGPCTPANASVVCRSGVCSAQGLCTAPAGCAADSDCTTNQFCNTDTKACVPTLSNGTALPTIGGHTPPLAGKCNDAAASTVCASHVCDTADDKCGFADGHGSCDSANAAQLCRSGVCRAGGTCGTGPANGPAGCASNAGCPSDKFCDTRGKVCSPKLPNGAPVPTIPGNPPLAGTCTDAAGAAACTAGVCDLVDNQCGFASGHGTCTADSAAIRCRSGLCDATGTCAFADDGSLEGGGCNAAGSSDSGGLTLSMLFGAALLVRGRRRRSIAD